MTRYAVLIGALEPENGMQKSLVRFKDFLTSEAGGAWREDEIMITGPLSWQFAQLLQARLREYDFVLVYCCGFSKNAPHDADGTRGFDGNAETHAGGEAANFAEADFGEKLRGLTEGGHGVFIGDVCDEVVGAEELGYEHAAAESAATRRA
ncbi:MAG: hypothetical protein NC041_08515 [Bacteroides sp.]|nr:hypothetical protein [Prevotella sp.]MCM1408274.1 hypothetical protein [Treponema brennaborense]MCM1470494.1 hypothetical protein [Bacteroides sp.]